MTIWLSRHVVQGMVQLGALYHPLETGGVLLGWRDGNDRIVNGLVGPGLKSLHSRQTFFPDHSWQVARIREAFEGSAGDLDYLGDWHTHPDGLAMMSELDRKTLSRIERRVKFPLMVIAAGTSEDWTINAWRGRRSNLFEKPSPELCTVRTIDPPPHWPSYFSGF